MAMVAIRSRIRVPTTRAVQRRVRVSYPGSHPGGCPGSQHRSSLEVWLRCAVRATRQHPARAPQNLSKRTVGFRGVAGKMMAR